MVHSSLGFLLQKDGKQQRSKEERNTSTNVDTSLVVLPVVMS